MFLGIETVRRLFPLFHVEEADAEEIEARRARGIGSRPSYLVQVMQSAGSVFIDGPDGEISSDIVVPPKLVRSTNAQDLSLPIETFVPTVGLASIPFSQLAMLLLYADSVSANKLIVQYMAMLLPNLPVHDALCYGRIVFFCDVFVAFLPCFVYVAQSNSQAPVQLDRGRNLEDAQHHESHARDKEVVVQQDFSGIVPWPNRLTDR